MVLLKEESHMPYPLFDRSKLLLRPLAERDHDFHLDQVAALTDQVAPFASQNERFPLCQQPGPFAGGSVNLPIALVAGYDGRQAGGPQPEPSSPPNPLVSGP